MNHIDINKKVTDAIDRVIYKTTYWSTDRAICWPMWYVTNWAIENAILDATHGATWDFLNDL